MQDEEIVVTMQSSQISNSFAMHLKIGYKQLVETAERQIKNLSPQEALQCFRLQNVKFVDVRDIREIKREGKIPGAYHCPRGMLEFWIDPESPYHQTVFSESHEFVFYCAAGWRSALATQTAQMMGLEKVAHIQGGFNAWKAINGPIEKRE